MCEPSLVFCQEYVCKRFLSPEISDERELVSRGQSPIATAFAKRHDIGFEDPGNEEHRGLRARRRNRCDNKGLRDQGLHSTDETNRTIFRKQGPVAR